MLREVMLVAHAGRQAPRPRPDEPTRDFLLRTVPPVLHDLQVSGRFTVLYLVMAEGARFPELADVYRTVGIAPVLHLVRLSAARAERRGERRSDALSRLLMLLVAPAVLAALWNNLFGQTEPLDVAAAVEAYVGLVFGGPDRASAPVHPSIPSCEVRG